MTARRPFSAARMLGALVALAAMALALWHLRGADDGLATRHLADGPTPVTVVAPEGVAAAPVVVIAHGFAGSRRIMEPIALTLARAGYVTLRFDFAGHGRSRVPMDADIASEEGATAQLVAEVERMAALARSLPESDGRLALLGHSMASDLVNRAAPQVGAKAVVALSMFSPVVTATEPRNLLMIVGEYEPRLLGESLRVLHLTAPGANEGETVGDLSAGTARRVVVADGVEHLGILYSGEAMAESVRWLNAAFGHEGPVAPETRGPWILLLVAGIGLMCWPLAGLLPRLAQPAAGAPDWRRFRLLVVLPGVATPLILSLLTIDFLPVLVADYLAVHFALAGALTAVGLALTGAPLPRLERPWRLGLAALAVSLWSLGVLGLAIESWFTSFLPSPGRLWVIVAMLAGTLPWFLADEALTRGPNAPRGAWWLSKLAFLCSLALAVALDFERLFFLILILPLVVLFFLLYGLVSRWVWQATGHPWVAGLANALAFAWAIGVVFPMLGGPG